MIEYETKNRWSVPGHYVLAIVVLVLIMVAGMIIYPPHATIIGLAVGAVLTAMLAILKEQAGVRIEQIEIKEVQKTIVDDVAKVHDLVNSQSEKVAKVLKVRDEAVGFEMGKADGQATGFADGVADERARVEGGGK